jgi:glycosyltransferase involved in cell wall biosynthesis
VTAPELSVVLPIYNEAENLPILLDEIGAALAPRGVIYEIVAVDDGSTDRSVEVLRSLRAEHASLRVLRLARNSGQAAALDAGWRNARGRLVVTLDADLQNDPADIPRLVDTLEETGSDMVVGVRVNRKDTRWKIIQSRVGNSVRNWITGDYITDTGCSLKLIRRECISRVKLVNGMHRFLPTLLRIEGCKVVELPVNHRPRRHGVSKYGALNRGLRGLADCFAVRWMKKRAFRYEVTED